MGDQKNSYKGFEDPFEEDPCVYVMKIIPVYDHLDELVGHHKGEDHTRDGDDDAFGEAADHGKDTGIPCRRRQSHLTCDFANLLVDVIKHPRQICDDAFDQHRFQPFGDFVEYAFHRFLPD